jgi:hypothetical protein
VAGTAKNAKARINTQIAPRIDKAIMRPSELVEAAAATTTSAVQFTWEV